MPFLLPVFAELKTRHGCISCSTDAVALEYDPLTYYAPLPGSVSFGARSSERSQPSIETREPSDFPPIRWLFTWAMGGPGSDGARASFSLDRRR